MDGVRAQVEVFVEVDGGARSPSDQTSDPLPLTGLDASLTMLVALVLLLLTTVVRWWRRRMGVEVG